MVGRPSRPLVSVVIPCFNQGEFVGEALASVRAQTWDAWEAVVVDDGSTESATRDALARLDEPQVRVVTQENRGVAAARNRGFEEARADLVLALDADDRVRPRMLEACVTALEGDPARGYAYTHMELFGDDRGVYKHTPYNFFRLLVDNDVSVCALIRRAAWEAAGGYSDAVPPGIADWDFWLRCGKAGWHGVLVPEALFEYRVRRGSMWAETKRDMDAVRATLRDAHPTLYSPEGQAEIRRKWCRRFDLHAPDSVFARAARALPEPLKVAVDRAYRRWILR